MSFLEIERLNDGLLYIYIYIYKLQAYNGYFDCHFLIVNIFFWGSNGLENL